MSELENFTTLEVINSDEVIIEIVVDNMTGKKFVHFELTEELKERLAEAGRSAYDYVADLFPDITEEEFTSSLISVLNLQDELDTSIYGEAMENINVPTFFEQRILNIIGGFGS